jgi:hypothetical protein
MLAVVDSNSPSSAFVAEIARSRPRASSCWCLEDIQFGAIDKALANEDEPLLLMLVASSFVESGTHLYASNLIAHFAGDSEVTTWLAEIWEREELQHGLALRTYVAHAWPQFDWERAYAEFIKDYGSLCTLSKLEARRGLEMAARCIVETCTTSLYRAIHYRAREPVLRMLCGHISEDEIGHYKHFFRYFRRYQQEERSSRAAIFGALMRRSIEIGLEDTECGLRYAHAERLGDAFARRSTLNEIRIAINANLRSSIPFEIASAMWLRPLQFDSRIDRPLRRALPWIVRALIV